MVYNCFIGTRVTILLENKLSKKSVHELSQQFRDVVDGISSEEGKIWRADDRKFAAQQLKRLVQVSLFAACAFSICSLIFTVLFLQIDWTPGLQ